MHVCLFLSVTIMLVKVRMIGALIILVHYKFYFIIWLIDYSIIPT